VDSTTPRAASSGGKFVSRVVCVASLHRGRGGCWGSGHVCGISAEAQIDAGGPGCSSLPLGRITQGTTKGMRLFQPKFLDSTPIRPSLANLIRSVCLPKPQNGPRQAETLESTAVLSGEDRGRDLGARAGIGGLCVRQLPSGRPPTRSTTANRPANRRRVLEIWSGFVTPRGTRSAWAKRAGGSPSTFPHGFFFLFVRRWGGGCPRTPTAQEGGEGWGRRGLRRLVLTGGECGRLRSSLWRGCGAAGGWGRRGRLGEVVEGRGGGGGGSIFQLGRGS